jgi:hypothetical protein
MIDQSLRTYILADSTITSQIATNGVYPQRLPQEVDKPCIVYTVQDGIESLVAGGVSALRRYQVDLTVFAEKYSEMREITQALTTSMNGLSTTQSGDLIQGCRIHNIVNDFEETLQLYTSTLDLVLIVKES